MEYLSPSSVGRQFRKVVNTFKGQRTRSFFRTPLAKYSIAVLAAALGGFMIAYLPMHYTPNKPLPSSTIAAPQQKTTPDTSVNTPVQNNPLFATRPSWSQNYIGQTSGIVDPLYWNVLEGPFNNSNKEQQYYTNNQANLRIENGALRLIATKGSQPDGYNYGSARIETQGKQSFLYGRIDITAKLPSGSGTWPAVWLLPANDTYAKKSSATDTMRYKNGGEIDVIESVGFQPGVMYGIAHTLSDVSLHADGTGSYKTMIVPNASTDFNKYTLLWTPTTVTFAVNDSAYYTYERQDGADYKTWPFDQPFYLIANLAMGGTWGGMDTAHYPGNGIDDSALPASLDIRSIYYYPYVGSTAVK